jgi:hypothetical protein
MKDAYCGVRTVEEQLDQVAVADVIQRERLARDDGMWPEMASCYHPESMIDVSWFQGDGAAFVEATRRQARSGSVNFDVMSPAIVTVRNGRATAETPCTLRAFQQIDGVDSSYEGFMRVLWRAKRLDGHWLIAGLRAFYIRDMLLACNPGRVPVLDGIELGGYRPSYRYLSYILARMGLSPRDDLPGEDRPEAVRSLRAAELQWLQED